MIDPRYLKHLLIAGLCCLLISGLVALKGHSINAPFVLVAYVFSSAFMSLVVVRLPVFRNYYQHDPLSLERTTHSMAESRAAPVMSSLVITLAFSILHALFDASHSAVPFICSAITAAVISDYHEK